MLRATAEAAMVHQLETRCADEAARADAAEAAVAKLTQQVATLTPWRRLTPLSRAASMATYVVLYLVNMPLYLVGTVLVLFSSLLAGGGNRALGMRTRNMVICALAVQAFTLDVDTLTPPHEQGALQQLCAPPALARDVPAFDTLGQRQHAPPVWAFDGPVIAALGQVSSNQSAQPCLMDNGASSCASPRLSMVRFLARGVQRRCPKASSRALAH